MASDEAKKLDVALALTEGLIADLGKRRSKFGHGTSYATVFDEKKHPALDRYWSPLERK